MKTEVLPAEIQEMAKGVSVEKRNEVQNVLNKVFDGVSKMREQLDSIVVEDENDKVNMKLANTIRLGVKAERLAADKIFNAKRSELKQLMLSHKVEDSLWFKAKQVKDILSKEVEENARWKEETAKRFEAEQKEIKIKQRENLINKFNPEILRSEFENMGDETFNTFLSGIEKSYNDKIEAEKAEAKRIEDERIAKEKAIEAQRVENERLKKEAELKEKELKKANELREKRAKELQPYIVFIRDYNNLISKDEVDYVLEFNDIKKGAQDHWEFERTEQIRKQKEAEIEEAKAKKERESRIKLEKELKSVRDAEIKALKVAEDKAETERLEAVKNAKAPIKTKLNNWVIAFELPNTQVTNDTTKEIISKFEAFKKWSLSQVKEL